MLTQGGLDQIIQGVQTQLSLIALPLYVIAAQIVGLALLFVAAMASLLIEYQSQGIATLKSRGTSGAQLLGIFSTQSALLGLLAVILGPFLAVGLALLLIRWFLPGGSSQGAVLSAASPTAVIAPPSLVVSWGSRSSPSRRCRRRGWMCWPSAAKWPGHRKNPSGGAPTSMLAWRCSARLAISS